MNEHPFIIHEAQFALWRVDADDFPVTAEPEFTGDCAEEIRIEPSFPSRRIERHGRPNGEVYHEDHLHAIEIRNVATINLADPERKPVLIGRNVRYALVVAWWDEEKNLHHKRAWLGVKGQPAKLDGGSLIQSLGFTAESEEEPRSGTGMPDLTVPVSGLLVHVAADGSRQNVYSYDAGTQAFTALDAAADVDFAMDFTSTPGELLVKFGGVTKMQATTTALHVVGAVEGQTFLDTAPRVEFWQRGQRMASLDSDGTLACAAIAESASAPTASPEMRVDASNGGGSWLFTLNRSGLTCPEIAEDL